jgi:hypothetical protein
MGRGATPCQWTPPGSESQEGFRPSRLHWHPAQWSPPRAVRVADAAAGEKQAASESSSASEEGSLARAATPQATLGAGGARTRTAPAGPRGRPSPRQNMTGCSWRLRHPHGPGAAPPREAEEPLRPSRTSSESFPTTSFRSGVLGLGHGAVRVRFIVTRETRESRARAGGACRRERAQRSTGALDVHFSREVRLGCCAPASEWGGSTAASGRLGQIELPVAA